MFKLCGDEDIDLEDEFLSNAFTCTKLQSKFTSNSASPKSQQDKLPPLRGPQNILTSKCGNVTANINERPSNFKGRISSDNNITSRQNPYCSNNRTISGVIKPIDARETLQTTPNLDNLLNETSDINWEDGFDEPELPNHSSRYNNAKILTVNINPPVQCNASSKDSMARMPYTLVDNPFAGASPKPNETPGKQQLRNSHRVCRKRKFPGPAGLLPTQESPPAKPVSPLLVKNNTSVDLSKHDESSDDKQFSQSTQNWFESDPWRHMNEDLDISNRNCDLLNKYNIAWVLHKAANKQLPSGKVPILIVILKTIIERGPEASVILKDETGEISATIHRKVFEEYEDSLLPGAVVVIRNASVISPTLRKHYLNVTPANLICVYSPNPKKPKVFSPGITNPALQIQNFLLNQLNSEQSSVNLPNIPTTKHVSNLRSIVKITSPVTFQQAITPSSDKTNASVDNVIMEDDFRELFEDLENDPFI